MKWPRIIQRVLTAALIATGVYLIYVFVQRGRPAKEPRPKKTVLPISPDYYVYLPKSYVRSLADARGLVGKPLWVREGYRWPCTPGPGTLGPMEKLEPARAFQRGGQVWLEFVRDGRPCAVPVGAGARLVVDEIFLIQDPRELYRDWSPVVWQRIAEGRAEPNMTETQITFALGYGVFVRELSRDGEAHRVMDYTAGPRRARVVYHYGVAKQVEALP